MTSKVRSVVELGDKVKDPITGITGIAVATTQWLYGCMRVNVQPSGITKEGEAYPMSSFDEPQLEIVKRANTPKATVTKVRETGGPRMTIAR